MESGQYLYDTAAQRFRVQNWTDATNSQGQAPPSGSWTALRVTLKVSQPTYFMKVMGVNSMPSGAVATAVRLKPGSTAGGEELIAWCADALAKFKVPKDVRFVSEFPMTASGKIQKFRLREMHEAELKTMKV